MKIALTYPYSKRSPVGCNPPISILYLAAAVRDSGHKAVVLDCDEDHLDFEGVARWVTRRGRCSSAVRIRLRFPVT
jgi:hypothetical protein